ncbi:MAG: hypothetical protein AAGM33_12645, partial [Pseudomonadota bacterium]
GKKGAILPDARSWGAGGNQAFFSETQGLYVVTSSIEPDEFTNLSAIANVAVQHLGQVKESDSLLLDCGDGDHRIPLADLREASDSFFRDWMAD